MSDRRTHRFRRMAVYLAAVLLEGDNRFARDVEKRDRDTSASSLVLPNGSKALVGMEGDVPLWFEITVPGHGMVRLEDDTDLVDPVWGRVELFLRDNNL